MIASWFVNESSSIRNLTSVEDYLNKWEHHSIDSSNATMEKHIETIDKGYCNYYRCSTKYIGQKGLVVIISSK